MLGTIRAARVIHLVSAFWVIGLALLIFADVIGRGVLSTPVRGTKEIIQNSIVCIAFLQLPLAIFSGSMLRTSIFSDALGPTGRRMLRTLTGLIGLAVFLGILYSTWPNFTSAYRIGEYEGEGALRIPVWPVRGLVAAMSLFAAWAYLSMIILDWRGKLIDELEAPGSLPESEA